MALSLELDAELPEVTIRSEFYAQSKELVDLFMVDRTLTEEGLTYRIASMIQSAYDRGRQKGWETLQAKISKTLFGG